MNDQQEAKLLCDGCKVNWPHEHRCHGTDRIRVNGELVTGPCECRECAEVRP